MAVRFKGKFTGADDLPYQVWIEDDNYGDAATLVALGDVPIEIFTGREGIDPFTPIKASHVQVNVWKQSAGQFDALFSAATGEVAIRLVTGDTHTLIDAGTYTTEWYGIADFGGYQESVTVLPDLVQFEAVDGLSLLENIPYTDTTGTEAAYEGRENYRTILQRILGKIGFAAPYRIASRLFPDGVAKTVDPWSNLQSDNARFYDEEGRAMSCYDVLRMLLYRTTCQIFHRGGEWHVVDLAVMTGSSYTVYKYTSAGAADGTTTDGTAYDIDTLISGETVRRETGVRSFLPAIGKASIRFDHGLIPSLIKAGDFRTAQARLGYRGSVGYGDDYTDHWTLSGTGVVVRDASGNLYNRETGPRGSVGRNELYYTGDAVCFIPATFHGGSTVNATVKSYVVATAARTATQTGDAVDTGQQIAFRGTIKIPYNAGEGRGRYMTYWTIEIDGQDYVLGSDGAWIDSTGFSAADKAQYIMPPGDEWGDGGVNLDTEYTFEFISETAPASGDIILTLYGTSDIDGSDLDPEGVEWDDITVTVVDDDGTALESTITELSTGEPDDARDQITVRTGPGPSDFMESRVTWAGTYYTDFETDLITTAADLDLITVGTWLRFLNVMRERRGEVYRELSYSFGRPLTIGSTNFIPVFHRRSVAANVDAFELVAHEFDAGATLVSASYADDSRSFVAGGGGGSSIAGGLSNALAASPITTKGDIIVGDSAGAEARLAVGSEGQILRVEAAATNGVTWATITDAVGIASGIVFLSSSQTSVTVTPTGISSSLFFATILCQLHTEAAAEEYTPVIDNITETTFDVVAQGTPGEQLRVQWLVISGTEAAALAGSLDLNPGSVTVSAVLNT